MTQEQCDTVTVYQAVRCNWQGTPAEDQPVNMVLFEDHKVLKQKLDEMTTRYETLLKLFTALEGA